MTRLEDFKKNALANPQVRKEYEALREEFNLINRVVKIRTSAGLPKEEVARKLGTSQR